MQQILRTKVSMLRSDLPNIDTRSTFQRILKTKHTKLWSKFRETIPIKHFFTPKLHTVTLHDSFRPNNLHNFRTGPKVDLQKENSKVLTQTWIKVTYCKHGLCKEHVFEFLKGVWANFGLTKIFSSINLHKLYKRKFHLISNLYLCESIYIASFIYNLYLCDSKDNRTHKH